MATRTRELLHDTGRGFATSNRFYEDDEIVLRLNDAKRRLAKALIMSPRPAYATLSRLLKQCVAMSGTAVPADFWYAIAGADAQNAYVPRVFLSVGEALVGTGHSLLFVKAGVFRGTANFAWYWAYPTQTISTSPATLTEFPDGFYDAVELLAARELLVQEQSDAADRFKLFTEFFMEAVGSFK